MEGIVTTGCTMDFTKYPYDSHRCKYIMGSTGFADSLMRFDSTFSFSESAQRPLQYTVRFQTTYFEKRYHLLLQQEFQSEFQSELLKISAAIFRRKSSFKQMRRKWHLNFSRIHQELPFPPGKDQKISNKNVSLGFLPKMNGHNPAENHGSRFGFTSW